MIKVYIAGPITIGDRNENIRNALDIASQLLSKGYAPFVPQLTCFWDLLFPFHYETWMKLDEEYIKMCDYVLRIPGESKGADREVTFARENNIPVFFSTQQLYVATSFK